MTLVSGHIISDIEGCDDCSRFALAPTDDATALKTHDTECTQCRPLTSEELEELDYIPGGTEAFCRISKSATNRLVP